MKTISSKNWLKAYTGLTLILFFSIIAIVVYVDPYFHYHGPNPKYYYKISNEREQNDGIVKHFDYQGIITGTSMTENFKTSEANLIFNCEFVKVPFSGATYNEVNKTVETALENNPECKIIVRGLDYGKLIEDKNKQRFDLGIYPDYLYDNNFFNDVSYVLNRNVLFNEIYPMIVAARKDGFPGGHTPFDSYSNWMTDYKFGVSAVYSECQDKSMDNSLKHLSEKEKKIVQDNISQNVTDITDKYPDVIFYYFFTPYSVAYWDVINADGTIYKQIEAEEVAIEEILKHKNIKLYSFNNRYEITTDLNNYKDSMHYGEWINSLMLRDMFDEKSVLTEENYHQYLEEELLYYTEFDYESLKNQEDYVDDYIPARLLAEQSFIWAQQHEIIGDEIALDFYDSNVELSSSIINNKEGEIYLSCKGKIDREQYIDTDLPKYLLEQNYIGAKVKITDFSYKYISFYGRKVKNHGQPTICVYDDRGDVLRYFEIDNKSLGEEWNKYYIDVSGLNGNITIIFNGGYTDKTGSPDSEYEFKDVCFY